MVVAHVNEGWMEVPGNLVAHIRVSPFYHARKQVHTTEGTCHVCVMCVYLSTDLRALPVVPLQ